MSEDGRMGIGEHHGCGSWARRLALGGVLVGMWSVAAVAAPAPGTGPEPSRGGAVVGATPDERDALAPPELPGDGPPPEIFVHASADRERAYVGQQVTVTWVLYTRHELIEFEPQVPRTDDFWTEVLYEPSNFVRQGEVFLAGNRYQVVLVSKRALFPLRPGRLEIGPYRARATALYTPLGAQTMVTSQDLEIQALPLPEGEPADFDDTYVGLFKIGASLDREDAAVGEPLVLTLQVRGHGAIRRTTPPRIEIPGFAVERSPDFEESIQSTDKTAIGVRQYRYWLTPERAGNLSIPAITIPYLDPRDGRYKRALAAPLTVRVHGDVTTGRAGGGAGRTRAASGPDQASGPRWWIPAGLFTLALLFMVLAIGVQRRHRSGSEPEPSSRIRLRLARDHMHAGRFVEFFAQVAAVIEGALSDRLGEPIRGLAREQVLSSMREAGAPPELVGHIRDQLEQCDMARFAASESDEGDMRAALDRTQRVLDELVRFGR